MGGAGPEAAAARAALARAGATATVVGAVHAVALLGEGQHDGQRGQQAHQEEGRPHLAATGRSSVTRRAKIGTVLKWCSAVGPVGGSGGLGQ